MTGKEISYIALVALPYFFVMLLAVLLLFVFPQIVTWLPAQMML